MGRKKKDRSEEVMEVLLAIIRARPDGVLAALEAGDAAEELAAVSHVKCKKGSDEIAEWEIKMADKLKAIELYLRFRDGAPAVDHAPAAMRVEYDYG